jgi:hypothetical protein
MRKITEPPCQTMNMTNNDATTQDGEIAFFACLLTPFIFYCCVVGVCGHVRDKRQMENRRAFIHRAMITRTWKAHLTNAPQDSFSFASSNDDDGDNVENADVENDATDSRNECPICLNTFRNDTLICESNNPACSHVYDACCMEKWLMKHDVCPICRDRYLIVQVEPV